MEDHTSSRSTVRETLSQPSYQPMQAPRDSVAPMKPMGHPEQTAGSEKSPAVSSSLGEATGSKDKVWSIFPHPLSSTHLSSKEVCLKFSKGRCHKGSSCPRLHVRRYHESQALKGQRSSDQFVRNKRIAPRLSLQTSFPPQSRNSPLQRLSSRSR